MKYAKTPAPRRAGTATAKATRAISGAGDRAARQAAVVEELEMLRIAEPVQFAKAMELLAWMAARSRLRAKVERRSTIR